jgi:FlaA1/EpsC-like NDP-sugar epimerase
MEKSNWITSTYRAVKHLTRFRRIFVSSIEASISVVSVLLAFLLRFDLSIPDFFWPHVVSAILIGLPVKLFFSIAFGVHHHSFRYVSMQDFARLMLLQLLSTGVGSAIISVGVPGFPRSIYFLQFLTSIILSGGARAGAMLLGEYVVRRRAKRDRKRVVVYGAGAAGVSLLREIRNNSTLAYEVTGFVDDQVGGKGLLIHGTRVLGKGSDLPAIVKRSDIEMALIAIPSASGSQMIEILENCRRAGIRFLTIPSLGEMMGEPGLVRQLRDVAVEDLLGRTAVRLEQDKIGARHAGRVVLVTGAAGSIGSELCRQIARFRPNRIVGFEMAESALFELQQELARNYPDLDFFAEIGSIQNTQRLAEVFDRHRPSIVYHAAAYKHVPMMEEHVFEAVENNVFGTLNVALAAGRYQVEDFVMISSDKAVRPTNVMGTTKRMAEMIIRSLKMGSTKYVSVRFGNVLGSNGSVVPIFKGQIARGGPVTVTHPEMRRYFMTIPEASQLVLQSATMGKGGEIFVLDMGEPVRILDLARNLILLSGLRPDHDIKIEFSGIRPGEKLYEELSALDENVVPTYHEKIKIFEGASPSWHWMERELSQLQRLCAMRKFDELMVMMKSMVPEYNPSTEMIRKALQPRQDEFALSELRVGIIQ